VNRKRFVAGGAALAASAGAAAPARATFGDTPIAGTVTLGVVAPFTGDALRLGEQIANGVRACVDDTNEFLGPLDKAYVMRTFDDQNLLATGMVNAEFACDDPTVVAVIGHLSGRITEAAMETYVNNKMTVICPASSYDRLTAHGYGNILRLTTKDSTEGQLAGRYIFKTVKPAAAVALYQDGDYGIDVASGFVDEMQGSKVKTTPLVFSWNKPDFPTVVQNTLAAKPDVIYLAGITKDMGPIVPQLRAAGYTGPLFGSQGFFDPATAALGDSADGMTISSPMPPLALAPGAFHIKNDFERRYGAMTPLSAFSYAAAQIFIAVIRRTGASDRLAVDRSLNSSSVFNTVVGAISFDNAGDPVNPNVYFYTLKGGNWKYTTSAVPSSFIVK
jgi:branched-chain amino acid transport system substrate-binding protein